MNSFEMIIGIEIHLALNTKTKMFSPAANDYYLAPNTSVHPIDLAYPGTLPRVNGEAIKKALALGLALKMEIDREICFDRKNYFYPDLPKGYQITQQFHPIAKNGEIQIVLGQSFKKIAIARFHLEEDTAQQIIHDHETWYDFNRAGSPLIEIVTDPVFKTSDEVVAYIKMIRELAQALNISSGQMELGTLRADINLSVRPQGQKKLGQKVEIKNLNSLSNIKKAIEQERLLQIQKLKKGLKIEQVTKRFDEARQTVKKMRSKDEAIDYRYFREPNIPTILVSQEDLDKIRLPQLPWEYKKLFREQKLNSLQIEQLSNDPKLREYFLAIDYPDRAKVANILFAEIVSLANKQKVEVRDLKIKAEDISQALALQANNQISGKHLKKLIPLLVNNQKELWALCLENNLRLIRDEKVLSAHIKTIWESSKIANLKSKQDKIKLINTVLGLLMKATNGNADPQIAKEIIEKTIN